MMVSPHKLEPHSIVDVFKNIDPIFFMTQLFPHYLCMYVVHIIVYIKNFNIGNSLESEPRV